jgi:hypothetical protein
MFGALEALPQREPAAGNADLHGPLAATAHEPSSQAPLAPESVETIIAERDPR